MFCKSRITYLLVSALAVSVITLVAWTPVAAQTCRVYCPDGSSVVVACNTNVDPCTSRGGGRQMPVPSDPRQIALENAVSRYSSIVTSLADQYNLLDKKGWLNLPHGTETQFLDAANQLHKLLVNDAAKNRTRVSQLRASLAASELIIQTYPEQIADINADIQSLGSKRDQVAESLLAAEKQLELTERAARQLEARALVYKNDTEQNRDSILMWLNVMLPPNAAKNAVPGPYESALEWAPSVAERQRNPEAIREVIPAALAVSKPMLPGGDITPPRLSGPPEDAAAQLETDAAEVRRARSSNTWELINEEDTARSKAEKLHKERDNAFDAKDVLESEISSGTQRLNEVDNWILPRAKDELQGAQQSFLYRAADEWIWKNARSEAIRQIKTEVKRLAVAPTIGAKYSDISDIKMRQFYDAGKRNIFGLTEKALSTSGSIKKVVDRIRTLQTHTQEYILEAARLGALGTPGEINEFIGEMNKGVDSDCEALVKANLSALKIPDPWNSIVSKYFIKRVD